MRSLNLRRRIRFRTPILTSKLDPIALSVTPDSCEVSFGIGGKQYIAVTTGLGGGSPRNVPIAIAPDIHHPGNGNALYVFSLPDK